MWIFNQVSVLYLIHLYACDNVQKLLWKILTAILRFWISNGRYLASSSRIKDSQDVDEEIDDIHVQVDGSKDVLLWRQIMHQHLDTKK